MPALTKAWNRGETYIVTALVLAALALVCMSLVARLADPGMSASGSADLSHAGLLLVCAVFIGGSALFRDGKHRRADVLVRIFSPRVQRIIESLILLLALVFCGVLAFHGWEALVSAAATGKADIWRLVELIGIPLGMSLMAVRCAVGLWRYLFRFDPATMVLRDDDIPPGS